MTNSSKNSVAAKGIYTIVCSALLCALGIMIPTFSPKFVMGPASFTLASHVPVFIAMFISPAAALAVSLCTGIGFFFSTSPVIAMRALSHVVFALVGSILLKKKGTLLATPTSATIFGLFLAVIHSVCEMTVVTFFYFGNEMAKGYYASGYFKSVLLLIGLGTVAHSMVDFGLAVLVWKSIRKVIHIPVSAQA